MWDERLAGLAGKYDSAVLTCVEQSGYPLSVRVNTELDVERREIRLTALPPALNGLRGKACLLFHAHDAHLERLRQLAVKGELKDGEAAGGAVFAVTEFVTANGRSDTDEMPHAGAPLHMFQFLLLVRRKAREYMAKRGAPWPPIPFDEIVAKVVEQK